MGDGSEAVVHKTLRQPGVQTPGYHLTASLGLNCKPAGAEGRLPILAPTHDRDSKYPILSLH